ncbi:hypothetical protein B0T24DRAFT_599908 [Lasiosphaeria ovina]|uniref:BHLH domain-containing protein n=1 Tax=Lasiosphaeria ovina TaxID=92902 RepID=A0AAE0JSN3_9PEZI|nr:hypothetical protein B0T24DRAFT_599908 [Lasiosphaeria ovina]
MVSSPFYNASDDAAPDEKRMTKAEVLELATRHIKTLSRENSSLRRECQELLELPSRVGARDAAAAAAPRDPRTAQGPGSAGANLGHMTVERVQREMDRVSQSGSPTGLKMQDKFNKVQESLATSQNAQDKAELPRMQPKFDQEMAKAEAQKLAQSAQMVNPQQHMKSIASWS